MGNPYFQFKLPPKGGSGTAGQISNEEKLIMMNLWKEVYVAFCPKKEYWPEDCANEAVTQFRKAFFGEKT